MKRTIKCSIKINDRYPEVAIPRFFNTEDIVGHRNTIALCHKKGESARDDALAEYVLFKMFKDKGDRFGNYKGQKDITICKDDAIIGINHYSIVYVGSSTRRNKAEQRIALENFIKEFDQKMEKAILTFKKNFK